MTGAEQLSIGSSFRIPVLSFFRSFVSVAMAFFGAKKMVYSATNTPCDELHAKIARKGIVV